jgi:hypothetical protein
MDLSAHPESDLLQASQGNALNEVLLGHQENE